VKKLRLLPDDTTYSFMWLRRLTFPFSATLSVLSLLLFATMGLNYGVDFRGGSLIEIQSRSGPADIGQVRATVNRLGLGDVQVQQFGAPTDLLLRIEQQRGATQTEQETAQQAAVARIRDTLQATFEIRRVETVGPQVSGELIQAGIVAVILSIFAILVYLWFRFEWQFAVGAIIATLHDVVLTIGFFAILGLEFNLSSVAAVLTIVGYSLNDTVVVYDRIRETMRRYKKMGLAELIDLAINQTLGRTILTSVTTLLALIALAIFGGEVVRSFTLAMVFGVVIGTYSSIFIAAPVLIFLNLRADALSQADDAGKAKAKA
jgi:preprotein translocase SecF subunit